MAFGFALLPWHFGTEDLSHHWRLPNLLMCLPLRHIFEWVYCVHMTVLMVSEWSDIYDVFSCQLDQPFNHNDRRRTTTNSGGVTRVYTL